MNNHYSPAVSLHSFGTVPTRPLPLFPLHSQVKIQGENNEPLALFPLVRRKPKRTNSERAKEYRRRKQTEEQQLVENVQQLRQQVQSLMLMRDVQRTKTRTLLADPHAVALKLVEEYFQVFKFGMHDQRQTGETPSTFTGIRQHNFMNSVADPRIEMGELVGIDQVLIQWGYYSSLHSSISADLLGLRVTNISDHNCSIISTQVMITMKYSRKTLENVFPHVLAREDLVQKLIGKDIRMLSQHDFYFDEKGRWCRYDITADYVGALLSAVGNIKDVSMILSQALMIEKQGALLKTSGHDEPQYNAEPFRDEEKKGFNQMPMQATGSVMDMEYILS